MKEICVANKKASQGSTYLTVAFAAIEKSAQAESEANGPCEAWDNAITNADQTLINDLDAIYVEKARDVDEEEPAKAHGHSELHYYVHVSPANTINVAKGFVARKETVVDQPIANLDRTVLRSD